MSILALYEGTWIVALAIGFASLITIIHRTEDICFAMLSGLLTGSGVGMLVLFRTNRHGKENFMILGIVYVCGVLGGLTAGLLF